MPSGKLTNLTEKRLRRCVKKASQAIQDRDLAGAESWYHEIKGVVAGADNCVNIPHTPGSLASVWYHTHWYHGNVPKGEQYFPSLRAVVAALEAWLSIEPHRFEESGRRTYRELDRCPFYRRDLPTDPSLIFMLMPFTEPWSDRIWSRHIKPAIERVPTNPPLVAMRADDLFGEDVMTDIFESILRASVVIADITNHNANVFYELGLSHAMGKRVLLIAQGTNHIPFDLLRFRHIIYEDNSEGCEILEEAVVKSLTEIVSEP